MYGLICEFFPGLFNYHQLVSLDYRELQLWTRVAEIRRIDRQLDNIHHMRVAMSKKEEYQRLMSELKQRRTNLWIGRKAAIQASWASLKGGR